MAHGTCPWWLGYALLSPLRRLVENPSTALAPLARAGMTVLEPGCGMGYFTLEAARLVGPAGKIVAVDLQPRMLAALERRARRAGLADRIEARLARPDTLGVADLAGRVDLALALHVVHEVPEPGAFLAELAAALVPGGTLVMVEPKGHVSRGEFAASIAIATAAGLSETGAAAGFWGWSARLVRA